MFAGYTLFTLISLALNTTEAATTDTGGQPSQGGYNIGHSPAGKVLFTKEGTTSLVAAYHVVEMEFDVSQIRSRALQLQRALNVHENTWGIYGGQVTEPVVNRIRERWPHPTAAALNNIVWKINTTLNRCDKLMEMFRPLDDIHADHLRDHPDALSRFHASLPHSREKRGVGAIVIGLLISAVAYGFKSWWSYTEINNLHAEVEATDSWATEKIDAAATNGAFERVHLGYAEHELAELSEAAIHAIDNWYKKHQGVLQAQSAADAMVRRLDLFENALTAAMDGRISADAFFQLDFGKVVDAVAYRARKHGLTPVSRFPSDWASFDVSWISHKKGFYAYLHVPLIDADKQMIIYRHHPLPIPLGSGVHLTVDPGQFEYLAIAADQSFYRAMTVADFNHCRSKGEFYLCDFGGVARKTKPTAEGRLRQRDIEQCLYALFSMDVKAAALMCDTHASTVEDAVTATAPHRFAAYTTAPHKAVVTCTSGNRPHDYFTLRDITEISLPPSCTADTSTHIIASADRSFTRDERPWSVQYDWPTDPKDWLADFPLPELDALLQKSHNLTNTTATMQLETVRRYGQLHAELLAHKTTVHPAATHGLPIAAIVLAIAAAIGALWCNCLGRRRRKADKASFREISRRCDLIPQQFAETPAVMYSAASFPEPKPRRLSTSEQEKTEKYSFGIL